MPSVGRLLAALALASVPLVPAAASDQDNSLHAPPPRLAVATAPSMKSSAILGSSASSLQAILSSQKAMPVTQVRYQPMAPAATTRRTYIRAHRAALPAHASLPNVFGTTALAVTQTPFDQSWARVASASVEGRSADFARRLSSGDRYAAIDAVNRYVNGRIDYVSDNRQFGREDRWMRPVESLNAGRGDCEDYAIAKMAMLKEAGIAHDDLYLVVLKDLANLNDHAVLVVRHDDRFLVLDNSHDRVTDANDISFFRPVMSFSSAGRWVHGYDRAAPRFDLAQASPSPVSLAANFTAAPSSIFAR